MILYYVYFHPASSHRCHCCMTWRVLVFVCQSRSFGRKKRTTSPYKKVQRNLPVVDSPDKEADVGNSPLCTVFIENDTDQSKEEAPDFDSSGNCDHIGKNALIETSMPISTYDFVATSAHAESNEPRNIVVVGNAKRGFQVKQLYRSSLDPNKYMIMPPPRLTSTPGDDLKDETSHPSNKPVTPVKKHGSKSPNTLVKNWVKDTQEFYKECEFSRDLSDGNFTGYLRNLRYGETISRRNFLRMKSFSKSDRLNQNTIKRRNKIQRRNMRDSIREAFGFRVTDLDHVSDDSIVLEDATNLQDKIVEPSPNVNAIKRRIDQLPFLPKPSSTQCSCGTTDYMAQHPRESKRTNGPIRETSVFVTPATSKVGGQLELKSLSNENMPPKNVSKLQKFSFENESNRSLARKKLVFKEDCSSKTEQTKMLKTSKQIKSYSGSQDSRKVLKPIDNCL